MFEVRVRPLPCGLHTSRIWRPHPAQARVPVLWEKNINLREGPWRRPSQGGVTPALYAHCRGAARRLLDSKIAVVFTTKPDAWDSVCNRPVAIRSLDDGICDDVRHDAANPGILREFCFGGSIGECRQRISAYISVSHSDVPRIKDLRAVRKRGASETNVVTVLATCSQV